MDRDLSKAIFFEREASLRNWSVEYGRGEGEGRRPRSTLFVVVSMLTTRMSATQNVRVSAMSLCLQS